MSPGAGRQSLLAALVVGSDLFIDRPFSLIVIVMGHRGHNGIKASCASRVFGRSCMCSSCMGKQAYTDANRDCRHASVHACMHAYVRACVLACLRACSRACVCALSPPTRCMRELYKGTFAAWRRVRRNWKCCGKLWNFAELCGTL